MFCLPMKNLRKCAVRTAALFFLFFQIPAFGQASSDIDALSALVATGTIEEKREALYLLRVIGNERASRAAVPALSDRSPVVRATAAGVVVKLPADEAAKALVPLLTDKEPFVRKETCLALGSAGALDSNDALLRVLEKDRKPDVRAAAATALGLIGDPSSVPALVQAIEERGGSSNAYLRRESAFAIGRIAEASVGQPESPVFPESFLPPKYKTSIDQLPSGFGSSTPALVRLLTSEKELAEVRRAAAFALGAIGAFSAKSEIERCAGSEDPYLAETCREALGKFSGGRQINSESSLPSSVTSTSFRLLDGERFRIADADGRPVLLVLWAIWCSPCVQLMEQLGELEKRYAENGLIIVALNVDPEPEEGLRRFVRSKKIAFRVGWADWNSIHSLFAQSEKNGVPQIFVLNQNHELREMLFGSGPLVLEKLENELEPMVSN